MQSGRGIQKMNRYIERLGEFVDHRFFGRSNADPSVHADIFVPNRRMVCDVFRKRSNALFGVQVDHCNAVFAEPVDAATKIYGLTDDYGANTKLTDQAAAIPAGSERRHHDFVAVTALPARFAKRICFTVRGGIALLHSAVVAASEQFSVAIE